MPSHARTFRGLAALGASAADSDAWARRLIRIRSAWGHSNYTKFVVLGVARTGSTMLVDLLAAHRQVIAFGELFRSEDAIGWDVRPFASDANGKALALYRKNPVRFLRQTVHGRWPREVRAVGFKLFYYHARTHPFSAVWDYLRDTAAVRIVHVKRRNILAQYLSLRLAHQTDVWSTRQTAVERAPLRIRLDPELCREHFLQVRRQEDDAALFFRGHAIKDVFYEDLNDDRERELRAIHGFLGLEPQAAMTDLVRQRRIPLSEAIENYAALKHSFAGTQWREFFNDRE